MVTEGLDKLEGELMGSLYKFSLEQLKTVYEALTLGQKSDAVTTWGVIKSIIQFLDRGR